MSHVITLQDFRTGNPNKPQPVGSDISLVHAEKLVIALGQGVNALMLAAETRPQVFRELAVVQSLTGDVLDADLALQQLADSITEARWLLAQYQRSTGRH